MIKISTMKHKYQNVVCANQMQWLGIIMLSIIKGQNYS